MVENEKIYSRKLFAVEFLVSLERFERRLELGIQGAAREASQAQYGLIAAPRNLDEGRSQLSWAVVGLDPDN